MIRSRWIARSIATGAVVSFLAFTACKEEGPMEKAGRKLDEAVEDVLGDKGALEKLGETLDDAADAAEEFGEDVGEAARDLGEKISE